MVLRYLGCSDMTFILLRLAPGDLLTASASFRPKYWRILKPSIISMSLSPNSILRYLTGILHLDLGPSYKYLDRGVKEIISDTLPTSVLLGLLAWSSP